MKISIVMAYYNRLELLKNTLKSISTHNTPYEIVIVDDGSTIEPLSEDIIKSISCGLNIVFYRFDPSVKTWCNPCIAYNKGFSLASGDVVIIQNPECYHKDPVVDYCIGQNFDNNYYVFSCYSLPENAVLENHVLRQCGVAFEGDDGWYQHSAFRNYNFHFTSAISMKNLIGIKGFDENYANGNAYDDNELLYRISKVCNIINVDNVMTYHQYHYSSPKSYSNISNESKFKALQFESYTEFKSSL